MGIGAVFQDEHLAVCRGNVSRLFHDLCNLVQVLFGTTLLSGAVVGKPEGKHTEDAALKDIRKPAGMLQLLQMVLDGSPEHRELRLEQRNFIVVVQRSHEEQRRGQTGCFQPRLVQERLCALSFFFTQALHALALDAVEFHQMQSVIPDGFGSDCQILCDLVCDDAWFHIYMLYHYSFLRNDGPLSLRASTYSFATICKKMVFHSVRTCNCL